MDSCVSLNLILFGEELAVLKGNREVAGIGDHDNETKARGTTQGPVSRTSKLSNSMVAHCKLLWVGFFAFGYLWCNISVADILFLYNYSESNAHRT